MKTFLFFFFKVQLFSLCSVFTTTCNKKQSRAATYLLEATFTYMYVFKQSNFKYIYIYMAINECRLVILSHKNKMTHISNERYTVVQGPVSPFL